jgi:hypothetical protein
MESDTLVVPVSKTKIILLLVPGVAFVALGIWILSHDPSDIAVRDRYSPAYVFGLGVGTVLIFGACLLVGLWRLFSNKPRLVLDSDGVRLFGMWSATFVPWQDVVGLSVYTAHSNKFLVLHLADPESFLESGSRLQRWLGRASIGLCGSPIAIASSSVKLSFGEMQSLFEKYLRRYRVAA